jgi:hypothetical protein
VIHKFSRYLILAICFGAISMFPAAADTLESLLGVPESGGLTVGDVVFYDFGFSASCSGGTGAAATTSCSQLVSDGLIGPGGIASSSDPGAIQISPDTSNGMDGFKITGDLETISDGTTATTLDISLTYDAAIVGPGQISDVFLGATAGFNGVPSLPGPSLSIEETVDDASGNYLNSLKVTDPPPSLAATITLPPIPAITGIEVTKDISLDSGAGSTSGVPDFAKSTTIIQQLSQVPEPRAYAAVLGLFFAMFFVIKRRRQQTA